MFDLHQTLTDVEITTLRRDAGRPALELSGSRPYLKIPTTDSSPSTSRSTSSVVLYR